MGGYETAVYTNTTPTGQAEEDDMSATPLIDRSIGLGYCEGDEGLYRDLLSTFVIEADTKEDAIKKSYEGKNWNDYGVYVHSLKSSSLMIGAKGLYDIALRMEKAAKAGETDKVYEEHDAMIELYDKVLEQLRQSGSGENDKKVMDTILEFMPKDEQ